MYGSLSDQSLDLTESLLFDFTRCVRPNGTAYGTRGKCRKGTEQEASKPVVDKKPQKRVRIGKTVSSLPKEKLEELLKDPRLKPHQVAKVQALIDSKGAPKKSAAERMRAAASKLEEKAAASRPPKKEKAKEKEKPKLSKEEEKARAQYFKLKEKADALVELDSEAKQQALKEVGGEFYIGSKAYKRYAEILKAQGITASRIVEEKVRAKAKAKDAMTPSLREEITAKAIKENEAKWKSMSRQEKRDALAKQIASFKNSDQSTVNSMLKSWSQMLKENPDLNTPENRIGVLALRSLKIGYARQQRLSREERAKQNESLVKSSPKYTETPGSRSLMKIPTKEENIRELKKQEQEHNSKADKYEKEGKTEEARSERVLARIAAQQADLTDRGYTGNPNLGAIYERQGYNARPEVVPSRSDLERRNDLIQGDDGKPLMLWRGVTTPEFATQFKGGGENGEVHFPGRGVYGNGTYAASSAPKSTDPESALTEARSYAGSRENFNSKVTAFGIRKDANIVEFQGEDWRDRDAQFRQWQKSTILRAEKESGYSISDIGEAAAILGIHAYRVPQGSREDFWVILNRGALVVAADPEIDDN
jgi:hypothetical protein